MRSVVYGATLFLLLLATTVSASAQSFPPFPSVDADGVETAFSLKNRMAANLNDRDWGMAVSPAVVNNVYDQHATFNDLEIKAYQRALLGMMLVAGAIDNPMSNRLVFYDVAYDVGLILELELAGGGKFILRTALLVTGESLRGEQVKTIAPGWIGTNPLGNMVPAYKAVQNYSRGKTRELLDEILAGRNPPSGEARLMSDRQVVNQRILFGSLAIDADVSKLDVENEKLLKTTLGYLENANAAARIAQDVVNCSSGDVGKTGLQVIDCIIRKNKFESLAFPTVKSNPTELGEFMGRTFVEEVLPFGGDSIAFVACTGMNNNFRFVITVKDGKPSKLLLIDFGI